MENKKIGVISLGCDKNRVDTEKMLSVVGKKHQLTQNEKDADVLIINTCAFLESARKEAVEEILLGIELKKHGAIEKIIVTGCLPQKFIEDIYLELIEVDAFLGVSEYENLNEVIDRIYNGERVKLVNPPKNEGNKDRTLTTNGYAYLKIADGCDNHCTYCLIPKIRGKYRSHDINDLVLEASSLGELGELILVAQDTACYGKDLPKKTTLVDLIKSLSKLENVKKIRLLYCYPENVSDELIEELKVNDKLIKYIDMPLQHADDKVLKRMNRKGSNKSYLELIERLRREVKGIAIRSTFIAGFPGEDQTAFYNLIEFLKNAKLDGAGFFAYSREEDTPAFKLDGQLNKRTKNSRARKLYSVQKNIVKENLKKYKGKTISVCAEYFDENQLVYCGRAYFNAPDIDGKVYFFSDDNVKPGKYYDVKINKITGYDLYGERV